MKTTLKSVVILLLALIGACAAQEVASIDLTGQTAAAKPGVRLRWHSSQQSIAIDGRRVPSPQPLTIAVTAMAPAKVHLQENVSFEVTITNNSTESFALPFSPNMSGIEPADRATPYKYIQTQIQLVFAKANDSSSVGTPAFLFGAASRTSALTVLRPGQSVRVRAQTAVYLHKNILGTNPEKATEVRAQVVLQVTEVSVEKKEGQWGDVEFPLTVPVASGNSIPIEIVPAQKKDEDRH